VLTAKKFKCLQCGTCCRQLRVNMEGWTLGLFLLPDEIKFFPQDKIAPMWGIGLKGRSRPRPETVGVFQLDSKHCPHITIVTLREKVQSVCRIYPKRPLICHAHPLSLTISQGRLLEASVNRSCKGTTMIPSNKRVKLGNYFEEDIIKANAEVSAYLEKMFLESQGLIWLYDLATHKWKRVAEETVIRLKS